MIVKRGRPESPASARKRDFSTPSTEDSSSQPLDRSGDLETHTTATVRASATSTNPFGAPTIGSGPSSSNSRSSYTPADDSISSPTDDSSRSTSHPASMASTTRHAHVLDTKTTKQSGLATPMTTHELSLDGTVISRYIANNFRCPESGHLKAFVPTEFFPFFRTGDVFIKTTLVHPPKVWRLHGSVLARHSSWFARSMQEVAHDKHNGSNWFYYTIEDVNGNASLVRRETICEPAAIEGLQQDAISCGPPIKTETLEDAIISNEAKAISTPGAADNAVIVKPKNDYTEIIDAYNEVFGAFFNVPFPASAANITTALTHAEHIVDTAKLLDCLHLLTAHTGNTLLRYRQALYIAIKNDPARWLRLSIAIQNDNIYIESLIHLAGAHPCWPWPTKRHSLPEEIRRLVAQKSRILDQKCLETERDLLTLTIEVRKQPVVPEIRSQFDTWFVVTIFRHVLATELTMLENDKRPSLKRGSVFRKIYKGGCNYMDTEETRRYMVEIMPSAVDTVADDLAMLKEHAKSYVEELAKNELMLNIDDADDVGYLTCTKVGPEDMPWRAAEMGGV